MSHEKRTFCRICEPFCPMVAEINEQGKVSKLKPDPDHPIGSKPCVKGLSFLELHNDPDRLNWPLKRRNPRSEPKGVFDRVSWDEAISESAAKLVELQQRYGKDAVAIYIGNPNSFDARAQMACYYALPAGLETKSIFTAGTQDCNNKVITEMAMYGSSTFFVPDLRNTSYFLCIGANPKASHWTWVGVPNDGGQILKDIKSRGGKVLFVNPRRIESSTPETGETLQIKPDTDLYFLAALSHEVQRLGGFDEELLKKHGKHVEDYKQFIGRWPAGRVEGVTGIPASRIREVAADLVAADGAACYLSTGVNQGRQGTLSFWLVQMLNFATGNLGREGGTYKATGIADPQPAQVITHHADTPDGVMPMWGLGALPGVLLPEIFEQNDVRALVCVGGNPLLSMSGELNLREAFRKLEFILCVDIMPNATTELADYVLPAADWLEREDTTAFSWVLGTQLTPHVQYTEAMEQPTAERRIDWWIVSRLLQAMGLPSGLDEPDHRSGFKAIDEMLSNRGLSVEQLRKMPHQTAFVPEAPKATLFDRCLVHEDGKIDCYPEIFVRSGLHDRCEEIFEQLRCEPAHTLKLISMRTTYMHNSWMANAPSLRRGHLSDNRLRMSPLDADKRELFDGDWVRAFTDYGSMTCRIDIRDDMREGVVAMTHGYGHGGATAMKVASSKPGANCNRLLPTGSKTYEPLSYMSWMCGVPLKVEKLVEGLSADA